MNHAHLSIGLPLLAALAPSLRAWQEPTAAQAPEQRATPEQSAFDAAATKVRQDLEHSIAELDRLRTQMADEKIPLAKALGQAEEELSAVRAEYQQAARLLDTRTLDLSNLGAEIKAREDEETYLSNLLAEYVRNFESRLHIAELQRYKPQLANAKLAAENRALSREEVHRAQIDLLTAAFERLEDALGGTSFEGSAVDAAGMVKSGTFVMVGPAAVFRSADGLDVGTAEQRLGSLEPAIVAYAKPEDTLAVERLVSTGFGTLPLDPTLGNAHKMEATEETFLEHIAKGGPVMYPIFVLAGVSFLVALYKWLRLAFLRKPSQKRVDALLDAVERRDEAAARAQAKAMRGPAGRMLVAGVEHIREPRELIEEVMFEKVLTTRLELQSFLPFISISAASAPLLGLLGTVTGIITTFKMITVYGSGDVKALSGGISEALITTEYGLIVAIPSLLLHAYLSRKARGVTDQMEKFAVAFANQVAKTSFELVPEARRGAAPGLAPLAGTAAPDPALVRSQVQQILGELLGPLVEEQRDGLAVAAARGETAP